MQEITLEELKEQLKALPRSERLQKLRRLVEAEWRVAQSCRVNDLH